MTDKMQDLIEVNASRRQFLKGAGVTAGLLGLMAAGVNPIGRGQAYARSTLAGGLSDLDILNFALTLEHLEAQFYIQVVGSGKLTSYSLPILTQIRDHEVAHVDFLTKAIKAAGGNPVSAQKSYNFGAVGDLSSEAGILKVSQVLESVGVGAYTGAASLISSKEYLSAAGSIEQVEARHEGAVRWLNDQNPAQEAFGRAYTVDKVKQLVAPILGS